jgi:hypothetical protein
MIYDEGIEFGMGEKKTSNYSNFFLFMNYSLNDGTLPGVRTKFYSHCYQTIIGWFYIKGNYWGCIWGHKKVENWNKPTNGEAPEKQIVLQNSITQESFLEKEKTTNNNNFNNKDFDYNNDNYNKSNDNFFSDSYAYELNFLQLKTNNKNSIKNTNKNTIKNTNKNTIKNTNKNAIKNKNGSMSLLQLNSSFNNHAEIVRRINLLDLGWTAKVYDNIHDKTLGQMNNMYKKNNPNASKSANIDSHNQFRFKSKSTNFNSENNNNFYDNFYFSNKSI